MVQVSQLQSTETDGSTVVGNPVLVAGKGSTNLVKTLLLDDNRNLRVRPNEYGESLFGHQLVANPYTLFDSVNKYYIDPLEYGADVVTGGTVSHLTNQSASRIAVTATSGSRARMRSHTFFRYQAGKAQSIIMTGYHSDTGQANQVRRWGYFDDSDGLFFEISGTGTNIRLVRRTSTSGGTVDNVISRASWNGDKLDGTGSSGVTLDITKGNLYEIRFQWLGVGTVQWWINGILIHTLRNANTLDVPYMKTAVLPVQVECVNSGASAIGSFTNICNTVRSEGGSAPPLWTFGAYNSVDKSITTTETPLLSIQPKSTFQSLINRIVAIPKFVSVSNEGFRSGFRIVYGGTLTSASFSSADANSGYEFDVAATVVTGGITVLRGFLPGGDDARQIDIEQMFHYLGSHLRRDAFNTTGNILTIAGINEASGSTNMRASITWHEIR